MNTFTDDPDDMTISVDGEIIKVDVCNVIPAMKAGKVTETAGLTVGNWAPVNAIDMSTKTDPDIYVLRDASSQSDIPKSAYSANSQAKVCANAIRGALINTKVFPAIFTNTCWSLTQTDDSVKVGATYEATDEKISKVGRFISKISEDEATRKANFEDSIGWYFGITTDMFS